MTRRLSRRQALFPGIPFAPPFQIRLTPPAPLQMLSHYLLRMGFSRLPPLLATVMPAHSGSSLPSEIGTRQMF